MAFLLGSEYCIQSLSNDVSDVQSCIKDIIFKIGRINSISWKFPDRSACDLNIDEYLINYKYDSTDKENNQVSHIILLELIIDRVCLLLQLHCESIEKIISKEITNTNSIKDSSNNKMISPCLGLTSKKHWNKLCQLSIYLENIHKEMSQMKKINKDLMSELQNLKINKEQSLGFNETLSKDNVTKQASDWLKTLESENNNHLKSRKSIAGYISKDVTFKSSQTIDTAFKPCESCHISQTVLREASSILMKILKEESQSSALMKVQQEIVNVDWLSDKKMLQVKDCFSKDIHKLCTHFRNIKSMETKTNEDLAESRKSCRQLNESLEKQKNQIETVKVKFSKEKEELDFQIGDYRNQIKQLQVQMDSLTEEFKSRKIENEKEMLCLTQKLAEKDKLIKEYDEIKKSILNFNVNVADPLKALYLVKEKISEQNDTISQLNSQIQNQKSVNENLTETENVIKEKEEKLVKRLQNLTQQKRAMEEKIDVLQDQLESNQESLRVIENQRNVMTMKLSDQTILIETISKAKDEFNIRIRELEEQNHSMEKTMDGLKQEKNFLLNYPDFNGPVEKIDSDNIEQDMRNQIKANNLRIKLLSDQNIDLEHALEKLVEQTVLSNQNQMTSQSVVNLESVSNSNILSSKISINLDTYRPSSKMSTTSKRISHRQSASNRPRSRDNTAPQNSIIQWSVSSQKPPLSHQPSVCESCGRQYQHKSDLDVHKEYCAGRRRKNDQK